MSTSDLSIEAAVRAPRPTAGLMVWLLGNAGVIVGTRTATIAIDPWTSDWLETASAANPEPVERAVATRLDSSALASVVDAVLITHEHPDHLDPGLVDALNRAGVPIILPEGCVGTAEEYGFSPSLLRPLAVGDHLLVAGFDVSPVPAVHAFGGDDFGHYTQWLDPTGAHKAVGYVVAAQGRVLFHGGDTVMWRGLDDLLRSKEVDTCLLPINGRDWLREQHGLVGNLTARESADLAASCGADTVIPIHFDGVVGNTGSPGELVDYASAAHPNLSVVIPGRRGTHLPPNMVAIARPDAHTDRSDLEHRTR